MSASPESAEAESGQGHRRWLSRRGRRGPRRHGASILSKLLLMMLVTSVLSATVVGAIGYRSGRESLQAAVVDRLTQLRTAQKRQLQSSLDELRNTVIVQTRGDTIAGALDAFRKGFDKLSDAVIEPAGERVLRRYYEQTVGEREKVAFGADVDITSLLPSTPAQKYLQLHYTVPRADRDVGINTDDVGDGSEWSAANARYNGYFRTVVTRSGFEDALLIDPDGSVVYSAYKNIDLGTNVLTGPYRDSNLAETFRTTLNARAVDYIGIADFAEYEPVGEPTAWVMAPISVGSNRVGVLALEFPIVKLNRMMTVSQKWAGAGMGETGETFLVGPDNLMRSDSRLFLEDPEKYEHDVVQAGTPRDVAEKAIRQHGTTLVQPIGTEATRRAARGETGNLIANDYLGNETLQSYAPATLHGLQWTIIAKIDTAEAFAPVAAFTRTLVLSTAVIIFLVCIAGMLLARIFVWPIKTLTAGANRIASGDYDVNLPIRSRDELGDLTLAFNDMGSSLRANKELIDEQRRENDRLLLSVMPEAAAQRYRDGAEEVVIEHPDVTVIVAETDSLDGLSAELSSDESLSVVNTLVRQFDSAAENLGVETVQSLHDWYMASCGLSVPRLDSAQRAVAFAIELQHIVRRFNDETGNNLSLRIGIDTGVATSGLLGRSNLAYDMWGSTVNLARELKNAAQQPGIYVTTRVRDAVGEEHRFVAAGTVDDGDESVWRLDEATP